jgi:hypothetical protein
VVTCPFSLPMRRAVPIILILLAALLPACAARPQVALLPALPPERVPVTNSAGDVLSRHEGPLWVLISGVDEHGLVEANEVALLATPRPEGPAVHQVHTGTPAAVHEIRQTGPQNLWRFYLVRTVGGEEGWVSDYFIRRLAYLFKAGAETVLVHETPGGAVVFEAQQVTPVVLLAPNRSDWWQVATADGTLTGWVETGYVKESPVWEFLLNLEHEDDH